jgi:hypothetical protein
VREGRRSHGPAAEAEVVAPLRGGWTGGVVRAKAPHVGMSKGRDGEDGALRAGGGGAVRPEHHRVEVGGAARRGRSAPMGGSRGDAERPI